MTISKISPLHGRNGETILRTLYKRQDYGMNLQKTDQGRLISAYQCNPPYAYKEFYATKQLYENLTGRRREHRKDVIFYLIVQSFKQGETSPEDSNRLAYETVMEFTKGEYVFIVRTHEDKKTSTRMSISTALHWMPRGNFRTHITPMKSCVLSTTVCAKNMGIL